MALPGDKMENDKGRQMALSGFILLNVLERRILASCFVFKTSAWFCSSVILTTVLMLLGLHIWNWLFVTVGVGTFKFLPDCEEKNVLLYDSRKRGQRDPDIRENHFQTHSACYFLNSRVTFISILFKCI